MSELDEIKQQLREFVKERDWEQFHNGKDLAISISLEASELLECFQWISSEQATKHNLDDIKDELADVLLYAIRLGDLLDIDLKGAMLTKLQKNKEKYPIEKAKGKATKYNKL
ncbi:nucleotide pyrophosphohydrolase [Haloplasma contractile]|uniref:Nucleotide pyrophosphohydrolase protein n=1 Tax=Haloplasma contractile SSD-17B TaxID=1033810 RepID=U2DZH6_9MOLU|nr:nucleotide pyrophosphohydrolase [Haloplasma contractile]ERJ13602.1 Nucleotide pyrophosphohydrolase protein [Haloplasma contractile SSD-17B]